MKHSLLILGVVMIMLAAGWSYVMTHEFTTLVRANPGLRAFSDQLYCHGNHLWMMPHQRDPLKFIPSCQIDDILFNVSHTKNNIDAFVGLSLAFGGLLLIGLDYKKSSSYDKTKMKPAASSESQ